MCVVVFLAHGGLVRDSFCKVGVGLQNFGLEVLCLTVELAVLCERAFVGFGGDVPFLHGLVESFLHFGARFLRRGCSSDLGVDLVDRLGIGCLRLYEA